MQQSIPMRRRRDLVSVRRFDSQIPDLLIGVIVRHRNPKVDALRARGDVLQDRLVFEMEAARARPRLSRGIPAKNIAQMTTLAISDRLTHPEKRNSRMV